MPCILGNLVPEEFSARTLAVASGAEWPCRPCPVVSYAWGRGTRLDREPFENGK
jgi:hypothetical protein